MNRAAPLNDMPSLAPASQEARPAANDAITPSFKNRIETALALLFGLIFLVLSAIVSIETIARKVFNTSLQGADELGGYALAIGSTIAFSLALMGRAHIRVDVFHERLSVRGQALLNWLSITSLAALGLFIAWVAFKVLIDTLEYGSTAPTPWATPLIYPQSIWCLGLIIFALVASAYAIRASALLFNGLTDRLNRDFSPKSAKEELKEELVDLAQRQDAPGAQP